MCRFGRAVYLKGARHIARVSNNNSLQCLKEPLTRVLAVCCNRSNLERKKEEKNELEKNTGHLPPTWQSYSETGAERRERRTGTALRICWSGGGVVLAKLAQFLAHFLELSDDWVFLLKTYYMSCGVEQSNG